MKKYPLYATENVSDLKELTDRAARLYKDKDAFRMMTGKDEYISVTYEAFGSDICALANALLEKGFAGKRIALIGENAYPWVLAYYAIVNINATVVPMDKELTAEEILSCAKRSGATVFLYSNTYANEIKYIKQSIPRLYTVSFRDGGGADETLDMLLERGRGIVDSGRDAYSDIKIDRERTCAILFTSGTTGTSKGVELTHTSLSSNSVSARELIQYEPEDVLLSVLPIHHSFESMGSMCSSIICGSTMAFCERIKLLPACLKLFRPTVMVLVPLYLETFQKRIWENARKQGKEGKLKFGIFLGNLLAALGINIRERLLHEVLDFFGGRLRLLICGGAHMNPALPKKFRDLGITVFQGYGTTECSPIISANRNHHYKDDAVGLILSCNEVRFDEQGQILVRGKNVMNGYLDDPQGTAEVFDGEWYKTGDLGYMDSDGFLYVTGRCKNLIILKNGKNIMPEEIEQLLDASPVIAESMIKEAPGDANGSDSLMAIVYPNPEMTQGMNEAQIRHLVQAEIEKINQTLVYYKRIQQFELRMSEFPKTTTRKIMRHKVQNGE